MKDVNLQRIYAKKGVGIKLAKAFNCTTVTVCNALAGKQKSELAKRIRHVAIKEYGANYVDDVENKEVITSHNEDCITHYFYGKKLNGEKHKEASLVICIRTGVVKHYIDGELSNLYEAVTITQLNSIIKDVCKSMNLDYSKHFKV